MARRTLGTLKLGIMLGLESSIYERSITADLVGPVIGDASHQRTQTEGIAACVVEDGFGLYKIIYNYRISKNGTSWSNSKKTVMAHEEKFYTLTASQAIHSSSAYRYWELIVEASDLAGNSTERTQSGTMPTRP